MLNLEKLKYNYEATKLALNSPEIFQLSFIALALCSFVVNSSIIDWDLFTHSSASTVPDFSGMSGGITENWDALVNPDGVSPEPSAPVEPENCYKFDQNDPTAPCASI